MNEPVTESGAAMSAAQSTSLNPRLAPQALDAERAVLGGILLMNEALFEVLDHVSAGDFYRQQHQKLFLAMQDLAGRNEPIDITILGNELREKGQLDEVGGASYLASIDASVPSTSNLAHYAKIVREKAVARRLVEAAHAIALDGYEQRGTSSALLDAAEHRICSIADGQERGGAVALSSLVRPAFATYEARYEKQDDVTGVASGLEDLDRMTAGWQPGNLIVIASRPGMGKTALLANLARFTGGVQKRPCLMFSLEMTKEEMTDRLFACESRVDGTRFRNGKFLDADWPKIARAGDMLARAPISIDDTPGLTVLDIRSRARKAKRQHQGLAWIGIDHLHRMKLREGCENENTGLAEITNRLKDTAKELEIPILLFAQLNRSLERRENKRAGMADLRGSGAIEQDADVIIFPYREFYYSKKDEDKGKVEIDIGKQRNGQCGVVTVAFDEASGRFDNYTARGGW